MPDAPITSTNSRAILAGFGTTVSLMGAATFAALVVTGVVAFSSWPDGAIRQVPEPVRLAEPASSGESGFALLASAAASAAPGASATLVVDPGDTPTQVPGSGADGESGTGNVPVAAAATPSLQSPSGPDTDIDRPRRRTTDDVADATLAASDRLRTGIDTATVITTKSTDNVFPRTSAALGAMTAAAGQSTAAAAEAGSEIIRGLPVGRDVHRNRP